MKLLWNGKLGSVELDGNTAPVHTKPFLPFSFDRMVFDAETGEAEYSDGVVIHTMSDRQIQQCRDWIVDAFDGGVAGT